MDKESKGEVVMNKKIKNHLIQYNDSQDWPQVQDDYDLIEILIDESVIYREEITIGRWVTTYQYVVEIDGMFIGFDMAETHGDEIPKDLGWEFDLSSVCEMEKEEKTITTYKRKKNG